ncbi:GGDEF domain-containing protein [Noviherbaspirillum sp. CPCC 100848]|uniref:diguanylate cyclase n=1 Tax=Noviherbaspirillum album TaxID=3080276 RepID=A0ABU6J4M8_9BURK|nr:GGDEF domain-containing protein [Noviherbaspirillum sp. CPCC 100848]MEC4718483.1 GGDEF domain-containing protein [Noviherbaspirillum sp. CPCC 100848]
MDVLTAGAALIVVQLCVALVMAGIFYAAPTETCTRFWALSGVSFAIGVLMVVLNAGAPRPLILIVGNSTLILGLVLQWCGIRAFFQKTQARTGWVLWLLFVMLFILLVVRDSGIGARALLSAVFVLVMLLVTLVEMWTGPGSRTTFARKLTVGSLLLLVISYSGRVVATVVNTSELLPSSSNTLAVVLIYFVPIAGTLLFCNGLLLLYFERVIADKHHLATHDELTGLLNRRALVAGGERELRLAQRMHTPITVALADIDLFKQINDTLGHEAGDRAIIEVARLLKDACRSVDLIGRYGGEEFCLVFPGTDEAVARTVAERLVQTVAAHRFSIDRNISISIGLASMGAAEVGQDWAQLVRRADKALYAAKQAGRNRHEVSA